MGDPTRVTGCLTLMYHLRLYFQQHIRLCECKMPNLILQRKSRKNAIISHIFEFWVPSNTKIIFETISIYSIFFGEFQLLSASLTNTLHISYFELLKFNIPNAIAKSEKEEWNTELVHTKYLCAGCLYLRCFDIPSWLKFWAQFHMIIQILILHNFNSKNLVLA